MRASSAALRTLINENNVQFLADLVTIDMPRYMGLGTGVTASPVFSGGTRCRWTTGDTALGLFSQLGPTMKRGGVRHASGAGEVSTMTLTLGGGWTFPNGVSVQAAAISGAFDDAQVIVERAFMATWGDLSAGTLNWFEGVISGVEPASTAVALTFKDWRCKLNQQYPRRQFQPGCPYAVFDSRCQVDPTAFTTGSLAVVGAPAPPTLTSIAFNATYPINTYARGTVLFTTGACTGQTRSIISSGDWNGYHALNLSAALPSIPAVGDQFTLRHGCDGLLTTCVTKFSNGDRFGGFPFVPKPESIR